MDTWNKNLVIIRWFYVKNCIFVGLQITDITFLVTAPSPLGTSGPPLAHKVELLQPPLVITQTSQLDPLLRFIHTRCVAEPRVPQGAARCLASSRIGKCKRI